MHAKYKPMVGFPPSTPNTNSRAKIKFTLRNSHIMETASSAFLGCAKCGWGGLLVGTYRHSYLQDQPPTLSSYDKHPQIRPGIFKTTYGCKCYWPGREHSLRCQTNSKWQNAYSSTLYGGEALTLYIGKERYDR